MRFFVLTAALACSLVISLSAQAQFSAETVNEFLQAQAAVYESGSKKSVERFVSFMSEEVDDYHVAYGRKFSGKDFYRENMPRKARALIRYERTIDQILLGTNVAIATFHETTEERKPDGEIRSYSGRTLMVIEFDDAGLITQLRRYQD